MLGESTLPPPLRDPAIARADSFLVCDNTAFPEMPAPVARPVIFGSGEVVDGGKCPVQFSAASRTSSRVSMEPGDLQHRLTTRRPYQSAPGGLCLVAAELQVSLG